MGNELISKILQAQRLTRKLTLQLQWNNWPKVEDHEGLDQGSTTSSLLSAALRLFL